MKDILIGKEAITKISNGLDLAAGIISKTLGPQGGNVYIDDPLQPHITNDGVTIAKAITLVDKFENLGAYTVKNAAGNTNDAVGDGTTTTTILVKSIKDASLERPENPMQIRKSLKAALPEVLASLKARATAVTPEGAKRVAMISAENEEIASLITEVIEAKGPDALITVEDSPTSTSSYEILGGYEAHVGYLSPYCVTDTKTQKAIHEDISVLVTKKRIGTMADLKPLFDQIEQSPTINSLVIICEDIDPAVIGMLAFNKIRGIFNTLLIRAGGDLLEDMASVVGATVLSDETGVNLAGVDVTEHLGKAKKIVSDAKKTLLVSDAKTAVWQANRLLALADNNKNEIEKRAYTKRAAKLTGGVAILRIGAATDVDREYLKFKAEDAVAAVKAALDEGIVEGGGMALYRIAEEMEGDTIGKAILKKALTAPFQTLVENCGLDYAQVLKNMPVDKGFDADTETYVDLVAEGIIDPAKVERLAVENAVSAVSVLITTIAAITEHEPSNS